MAIEGRAEGLYPGEEKKWQQKEKVRECYGAESSA